MDAPAPLFTEATAEAPPRVGVIAEIGVNHDGDPAVGVGLVDTAADAGADAVKVQLFNPDRLLSNQAALAKYQAGGADDARELLAGLALGVDELAPIAARARARGMWFLATPFSPGDIADLRRLEVDAIKIASPDAVNPPLLEAALTVGKPMLVSTGTCELAELGFVSDLLGGDMAAEAATPGETPVGHALLHCVSSYPTPRGSAGLGAIAVMRSAFGLPVGYSDHTPDLDTGALAVSAGAVVIEKHLTHDKAAPGPDHAASLTGRELAEYVSRVRDAQAVMGPAVKRVQEVEADVRAVSRQSVCLVRDLPAGHVLIAADLTVKRPGTGIPAAKLAATVGRRLAVAVRANDLLTPDQLA